MKWITFLFVALSLGLLAWWGLSGPDRSTETLHAEGPDVPVEENVDLHESVPLEGDGVADLSRSKPDVPDAQPVEDAASNGLRQGRIVLIDEDGIEHGDLSGELTLTLWTGRSGEFTDVLVDRGAFQFERHLADAIAIRQLSLGGRSAADREPNTKYDLEQEDLVLTVTWIPRFKLSVLGAETGTDLDQIQILHHSEWSMFEVGHPGDPTFGSTSIVVEEGRSPVWIEPSATMHASTKSTLMVHSPGYAWKSVQVNFQHGGEREVRLDPGGRVTLHVTGEVPPKSQVRLRRADSTSPAPYSEHDLGGGPSRTIGGLTPGDYVATAEIGAWYSSPPVIGTCSFQIEAGITAQAELVLEPPPEIAIGILSGSLHVPTEWQVEDFKLGIRPEGHPGPLNGRNPMLSTKQMTGSADAGSTWTFEFPAVPIGAYRVTFYMGQRPNQVVVSRSVELVPEGTSLDLSVPPPATVFLTLLDAETGEVADIEYMSWGCIEPSEMHARSMTSIHRTEDSHSFQFRAPQGSIQIHSVGNGYLNLRDMLLVQSGDNSFEFRMEKECGLKIALMDGETPVPLPVLLDLEAEHLDGDGEVLYVSPGQAEFGTAFSEPGQYRFDLPDLDEYEPIPTQTVTLERGKTVRHVIQLVRKP
tara:strand:- start:23808 stop:25733 length:1926 start_codon:yes stop_codon:yes gene_type:complete